MSKLVDLTGRKIDRLTVIKRDGSQNKKATWLCKCDCGREIRVLGVSLTSGNTKSCGCLRQETVKNVGQSNKKHGMYGTRIYTIWADMKKRCLDKRDRAYKHYGARGISIYKEWYVFENFYEWAKSSGYEDNLTLDRKDVNGDYTPNNCKWSTWKEQQNNRRSSHMITFNGETKTISQWSNITGIPYNTLIARINILHWDIEKALTVKNKKR